ncbi:MAG: M15 family metallopeptidase [Bacilli bacterium]
MKKRRIKKKSYVLLALIILIIGGSVTAYKYKQYINSNGYKLEKKGYNEEEIKTIIKSREMTDVTLKYDYNKDLIPLMKEKYFLKKNLDTYLKYLGENPDFKFKKIVSIVNVGANKDWYDVIKPTNLDKGNLILVNKYNYLSEEFVIDDLVKMSIRVAFEGKEIRSEVNDAFTNMCNEAKTDGLVIVANSTYRNYNYQASLYKRKKNEKGQLYADSFVARPGHSEHQTGLSIDVSTLKNTMDDFEKTKEFEWLIKNAYKYGFILRYPKGKEYLTGYNYESWHFRYVGIDAAKKIKDEGITFDEYYAYYVEG